MIRTRYEALRALGLGMSASKEDCKRAYRNLCKLYHPDNNGSEQAGMYYHYITEAYSFLENESTYTVRYGDNTYTQGKVIGKPVGDSRLEREKTEKKIQAQMKDRKEKKRLELERKVKELEEQKRAEKEKRILDEIRWLRVASIINETIREDALLKTKQEKYVNICKNVMNK